MKYKRNKFVDDINDGEYTLVIAHDQGTYIKLRSNIWNNIQYYMDNDLEIDAGYYEILKLLLELGIIFNDDASSDFRKSILLQLTSGCNLKCAHCCATTITTTGIADIKVINKVLDLKPDILILSGGEPMLHPDFFGMIRYIRKKFCGTLSLMTNGTLIDSDNINELCEIFDYFDISLDGATVQEVNGVRGCGVYEKVVYVVNLLRERGKKVGLSYATEKSDEDIEGFYRLADSLDVIPVVRTLNVVNRVKENFDTLIKGGQETYISTVVERLKIDLPSDTDYRSCGMLHNEIFVDVKGNIYPCGSLAEDRFCVGNIYDIKALPNRNDIKEMLLQDEKFKSCRTCKYLAGCWACMGEVVNYSQFELVFEVFCQSSKNKWSNILRGEG